jgi:hypothetical protein
VKTEGELTNFEYLRARLLHRAGVTKNPPILFTYEGLRRSEWSARFESLMRNRLIMGALRYGRLHAAGKPKWDRVAGMRKRLFNYTETGNLECLVDIANLALLEFEEGTHPHRNFTALDGDHSCT